MKAAGEFHDCQRLLRAEVGRGLRIARGRVAARVRPRELSSDPVFLVGCPRSGTTLLFELLKNHPDVVSLEDEGHVYWTAFNHPRNHDWSSDALNAADVTGVEHRYLDTAFVSLGPGRPLDKTPKNVLRLPYLREHYPTARIVLLVRDGRATVASLLEGWRRRRGGSYLLPERLRLRDYDSRIWRYILPPGWRSLQGAELAGVATAQYEASLRAASANRALVDAVVHYEDLLANPITTMDRLLNDVALAPAAAVADAAARLSGIRQGSISPPRQDKWRDVAPDLAPYMDRLEDQMSTWGYHPD